MTHRKQFVLFVALVFFVTGSAFAASDYLITGVNGDGVVSARAAATGTASPAASLNFRVPDAKAFAMMKVGQKISIDTRTGQASMQDFHFNVMLLPAVRPSVNTAMAVPMQQNLPRSVTINGKLLTSKALMTDGRVFVPLADFSAALGNSLTLEPALKLQFPRLSSVGPAGGPQSHKGNSALKYEAPAAAAHKTEAAYTIKMNDKVRGFQLMNINKAGVISNNLRKIGGQIYVPLNDILIGLSVDPTKQNMNAPALNFSVPANANALIGLL